MSIPGGTGTRYVTDSSNPPVLGAPASIIGSELPWLTGFGPSLCAPSALRGASGDATMVAPVGRAQHHAPVCSQATRTRRAGFSHGSELSSLLGSGPSLSPAQMP